jgi:hypothetical protein
MDVEKDQKNIFREMTNISPNHKMKDMDPIFSPSSVGRKKDDKKLFFESTRKEGVKAYYT